MESEVCKPEDDSPLPVTTAGLLGEIRGGQQLLEWFGHVPSFHDAEVLELTLDRKKAQCRIKIHAFQMTPEIDAKGLYVLKKHILVSFRMEGVMNLELTDFNHQNVINGLALSRTADQDFRLDLDPCYGLFGFIEARALAIDLEPGKPRDGAY
jgi:hypothetical protein